MKKVLYLSYDGMTDALGYSQVFVYLKSLSREFKIFLVSFEKKDQKGTENFQSLRKQARDCGIFWIPLTYHKSPTIPATAFDIFQGVVVSFLLVLFNGIRLIHARSYVAMFMGWFVKMVFRTRLLFDMRGFWADERIEGGLWRKKSKIYRVTKWLEKRFIKDATAIVSLTQKGKDVVLSFRNSNKTADEIEVIPTCADLGKFKPLEVEKKFSDRFVVGYSGSVGLWYDFPASIRAFLAFQKLKPSPAPLFLILNRGEHEKIKNHLKDFGIEPSDYLLVSADSDEMPYWINQMQVNVYFIRPSFSKQASSPTKFAEVLGCGVSVVTNLGVGDSDLLIGENRVGVLSPSFSEKDIDETVKLWLDLSLDPLLAQRCIETARKYFSIEQGVQKYSALYNRAL